MHTLQVQQFSELSCHLRRVHTNPLKCTLDHIASNRFEPIRIRSVHTLVTKSEFDYRLQKIYLLACDNMKVYLEIYALWDAIMDTITSFFRVYNLINHEVLAKLQNRSTITSIAHIIYGTTRAWRVDILVTHGITDKAPYLSEEITLRLLFLSLLLIFLHNRSCANI